MAKSRLVSQRVYAILRAMADGAWLTLYPDVRAADLGRSGKRPEPVHMGSFWSAMNRGLLTFKGFGEEDDDYVYKLSERGREAIFEFERAWRDREAEVATFEEAGDAVATD